jgi:hypothetical protein
MIGRGSGPRDAVDEDDRRKHVSHRGAPLRVT